MLESSALAPTPLTPALGEAEWSRFLVARLGLPVRVRFGDARRNVLVAKAAPDGRGYELRLNRAFGQAPVEVREAVAAWLRSGKRARKACALLDEYVAELARSLPPRPRRLPELSPRGATYDLRELLNGLRHDVLSPELLPLEKTPHLTWGRRGPGARRSLRLGSYDHELHLVRIHPVLDQPGVPDWFVRFVLFHELLHAALPSEKDSAGRSMHHGPRFKREERAHPDYDRSMEWEEENLAALLRSSRDGKPVAKPRRHQHTLAQQETIEVIDVGLHQGLMFEL